MDRRQLLRGMFAAPVVATLPTASIEALFAGPVSYPTGTILATGAVPRLLQEGIRALAEKEYANYPRNLSLIFAERNHG